MSEQRMVTWQHRDGTPIGEFDFVTGTDWFDEWDEPTDLIRRTWVCVEEEVGTWYPACPLLCGECWGDGEVPGEAGAEPVRCPECRGSGESPMARAGWVVES